MKVKCKLGRKRDETTSFRINIFFFRKSICVSQLNTNLYHSRPGETENQTNLHLEPHDYRIYYVNVALRYQYAISVVEAQTFLLAKLP